MGFLIPLYKPFFSHCSHRDYFFRNMNMISLLCIKPSKKLSMALRKEIQIHQDQFGPYPPNLLGKQAPCPCFFQAHCQHRTFALALPFAWNILQPALSGHCFSSLRCKQSWPLHRELLPDHPITIFNSIPPSTKIVFVSVYHLSLPISI